MFFVKFLVTAFVPHVLAWLGAALAIAHLHGLGLLLGCGAVLVAGLWSYVAVTGGHQLPPRPTPPAPPRSPRRDGEDEDSPTTIFIGVVTCSGLALVVLYLLALAAEYWQFGTCLVAGLDALATLAWLVRLRGYQRFLKAEAGRAVVRFYDEHADVLSAHLPRSLLHARLRAGITNHLDAAGAWEVAHELIRQLDPIVRREHSRCVQRQTELAALETKLAAIQDSDMDPEVIKEEADAIRQRLRHLQEREALKDTFSPDDL